MADYDVVIIGAGAAGLAAAATLTQQGYRIALVEARDRIGGRVYTIRPPGATLPIELGADFVHGRPDETFALAAEAGLRLYEQTGNSWAARAGGLRADGDDDTNDDAEDGDDADNDADEGDVGAIFAAIHGWQGEDRSLQYLLDERFAGERWAAARARIRGYAEGFDAAEVDRVSIGWLRQTELASDAIDGDRQYRVLDGYDRVLAWLGDKLAPKLADIRLESIARELRWQRGQVAVSLESPAGNPLGDINARVALVTVPLAVLKRSFDDPESPGALRLAPEPPGKREALAYLEMGHAMKVVLRLRMIFWEKLDQQTKRQLGSLYKGQFVHFRLMPRLSFLFGDDPVMSTWWTTHPVVAPMLTGWAAGPRAARLANESEDVIADEAVAALSRALDMDRADLEKLVVGRYVHNWGSDPFAGGGYSYVCTGGLAAPTALAAPVEDTLFFAGEATNTQGHTGTVHGALQSGYQAAAAILRSLATPR
jgi:monoamine oxidase